MSAFSVELTPAATRDVKRFDPAIRLQLLRAATVLHEAPHPGSSARIKPLMGITPRHYRLRVGDYRIIYRVEASHVVIVRVAHRREAYQ